MDDMRWVDDDLARFADATARWRAADPIRTNVVSTVVDARLVGAAEITGDELWARLVDDDGNTVAVSFRTPPYPLFVTPTPLAALPALAALVRRRYADLPGVTGEIATATAFAREWTGDAFRVDAVNRWFTLGAPTPPDDVPGRLRAAVETDLALIGDWTHRFAVEALGAVGPSTAAAANVRRRFDAGTAFRLWDVDDAPVSMMLMSTPQAGVARVQAVYTPVEHRRNGYAAAMVAAASVEALERTDVTTVGLFADTANPTSCGVYRRIGFVDGHDTTQIVFAA